MSVAVERLIPDYLATRRGIVQKIAELRAEQEMIHHQLRLGFMKQMRDFPEWLHDEIEKYIAADEGTRRDFLDVLVERTRYITGIRAVEQLKVEAERGAHREGQIRLDLSTWVSMRNSVSFAIDSMMKYTTGNVEDVEAIQREARSYEKNRIKPIDYIEDLAAPEWNEEHELAANLQRTIISEPSVEDSGVTISILDFSKRQQEILHLWIVEGKSYSQIAEELGITKDSVAQHIDQARKKAMKLKKKQGIQQAFREVMVMADIAPVTTQDKLNMAVDEKSKEAQCGEQLTIDDA